jgi:Asp-tRNA(Asn)/Glu-tRNA(Gln) amidotransferase C subunit
MTKLPVYEMVIDENPESEVEVSFVALVDKPAIEKNFMAFASGLSVGDQVTVIPGKEHMPEHTGVTFTIAEILNGAVALKLPDGTIHKWYIESELSPVQKKFKMDFAADPVRQIISGPAMIPDTLIYRRDAGGEYDVFFSKETINQIALKFFKKDYQKNLNMFHDPMLSLQGVTIFESFISDKARGIQPMKGFEDLPDGTWFISAKVENPDVWAKVMSGEVKGFSVEGIFSYSKKPKAFELDLSELLNRTYNEKGLIPETDIMSLAKDLADKFKKTFFDGTPLVAPVAAAAPPVAPVAPPAPAALGTDYQLKDGTPVQIDRLEVGGVAMVAGVPAPAGDLELADGTLISVGEGGVIAMVTPGVAAAPAPAFSEVQMAALNEAITKAFTDYKTEMAAEKLAATAKMEELRLQPDTVKVLDNKLNQLFEIVEELTKVPTAEIVGDKPQTFSASKNESKEAKLKVLSDTLKKLKSA